MLCFMFVWCLVFGSFCDLCLPCVVWFVCFVFCVVCFVFGLVCVCIVACSFGVCRRCYISINIYIFVFNHM